MSIDWCRLWHDMPTDPKFRAVAKRVGRPTAEVVALFTAMLTNASANETERGTLRNWCHEDMGVALDIEPEHVEAIYRAMQGKLLDGDKLLGWERRQPQRERDDNSTERTRAWRERQRTPSDTNERHVTPSDALDKDQESDKEKETASKSTEQEPARAECADGKPRKQDFKFDAKGWAAQAKPAGKDKFSTLIGNAEGFGIDVTAHQQTVDRKAPANRYGYLRSLIVKDLRVWMPQATDALLHAALKGETDAKKLVFEAMTSGGTA